MRAHSTVALPSSLPTAPPFTHTEAQGAVQGNGGEPGRGTEKGQHRGRGRERGREEKDRQQEAALTMQLYTPHLGTEVQCGVGAEAAVAGHGGRPEARCGPA